MARHVFEWISLDASTWRISADKAGFLNPFDLSRESLASAVLADPEILNDCPCPYCKGTSFVQIINMPFKQRIILLRQHNWWVLQKAFRELYDHSIDIIQLGKFLKTRSKHPAKVDELIDILSFVDIVKDSDISLLQDRVGFKP
jgi:hypothetical protein